MKHTHNHHNTDIKSELTFEEKILKLLDHWLKHNEEHTNNYLNWAQKAEEEGHKDLAELIRSTSAISKEISEKFHQAIHLLKK